MLDSKKVQYIENKHLNGEKLTRSESILYRGEKGTKDANLHYIHNNFELKEYSKSLSNIYFIETFFNIKLKSYNLDWINNSSRFTINLISNEMGCYKIYALLCLHELIFTDNTIFIITDKKETNNEFMDILLECYKQLPFFLKPGIFLKNKKAIRFDTGSKIVIDNTVTSGIGFNTDHLILLNFSDHKKHENLLNTLFPVINASTKGKINIISKAGDSKTLKELVEKALLKDNHPKKNLYKVVKTYWWENVDRDDKWKYDKIKEVGEEYFKSHYEIEFK